jgi:oligosaccharide repeat unit polymerase
MSIISTISFLICLFIIVYSLKKDVDIFSPAKVFSLVWCLSIGLADLKLSRYQPEWKPFSWFALLLSVGSFLIGIFVVYSINYDKKVYSLVSIRQLFKKTKLNDNLLFYLIIGLFTIYILSYVIIVAIKGFIPIFHSRPSESRVYFGVFGIGLFIHLAPTIIFFIVHFLVMIKGDLLRRLSLGFIGLVTFITYFFLLQRFDLIFAVVISIVFLYYSSDKLKFKNTLIIFLIFFILFYSIQAIRLSKFAENYYYYMSAMKFSKQYSFFTGPYMYVAMNLENFANAVYHFDEFNFGFYSFNSFMSITGLKHWIEEYAHLEETPFLLTGSYNTYSMFWEFFRDFGMVGISILSFALGALISNAYYKMKINPNVVNVSMYSVGVFVMSISFFLNPIGVLNFIFNITVIYFGAKYCMNNE